MRHAGGGAVASAAALAAVLALTGCSTPSSPVPTSSSRPPSVTPTPTPTPRPTPWTVQQRAAALVASMSTAERAGQVLMTAGTVDELRGLAPVVARYHLAGLMVRGRSAAGTAAVRAAFAPAVAAAPEGLPLLTATDQEGGLVQVLSGPGFATIPSANRQAGRAPSALQDDAAAWGRSLAAAGVRLDLAPVADVPCAADLHDNPPVADLDRNYGTDPAAAGEHVAAFLRGLREAGVAATVKHFPGLGCVTSNTDTSADVVDRSTTEDSPGLASFAAGIDADAGFVMVSSASYARIDPGVPALFSSRIVGDLLRGRLGFTGVVISDDTGGAVALKAWTPAQRVVKFVRAGGDLLLDIVPADVPALHAALVDEAGSDPAFDAKLTAAATRVVAARLALVKPPAPPPATPTASAG